MWHTKYWDKTKKTIKIAEIKIRNFKLDKRFVIFTFFFAISSFLWLIQALNRSYITQIKLKTVFEGTYHQLAVRQEATLRRNLLVQVEGTGFDILRYKFNLFTRNAYIPIENLPLIKSNNNRGYYFYTNTVKNNLQLALGQKIKLLQIQPDTLFFMFTKEISKKVAVLPNFTLNAQPGYAIKGKIRISPDSVTLLGPDYIVDKINSLKIENLNLKNVNRDIRITIKFKLFDRITADFKECRIEADIEAYTEMVQKVDIETINVPDSLRMFTFPPQVDLVYRVFVSDFKKINNQEFEVAVDYKQLVVGQKYAELFINKQSQSVFDVRIAPEFVEYLIETVK